MRKRSGAPEGERGHLPARPLPASDVRLAGRQHPSSSAATHGHNNRRSPLGGPFLVAANGFATLLMSANIAKLRAQLFDGEFAHQSDSPRNAGVLISQAARSVESEDKRCSGQQTLVTRRNETGR